MKYSTEWKDYRCLATGDGYKLEDFGGIILLRPDPQIIWKAQTDMFSHPNLNAVYIRSGSGGGEWDIKKEVPSNFQVHWRDCTFSLKLMGFKHTGIFPEQAYNWERMTDLVRGSSREISVLNLFAYTGGATVALSRSGAKVTHVDAAKNMCERAGLNAELSGVKDRPIRYIVDDCVKFVEREIRRGKKYDAVIMDPPSYGRGPRGEMWKLEDRIFSLIELTKEVMSDEPLFFLVNSYTTGLQPTVMKNILEIVFRGTKHTVDAYELGIKTEESGIILPSGTSAFMEFTKELK